MNQKFLSSEEYDERAHRQYDRGDFDGALATLKEGLALYPNAVELYIGLGYARAAREEFAWARHAFERALTLDAFHEDALVGLGETLLRMGELDRALALFGQVQALGFDQDLEVMLTMGRALFAEDLFEAAHELFSRLVVTCPESAEASAALGYAIHRKGDEVAALLQLRRALRLDPGLHEARVYLGHLLFDRGEWEKALIEFERVPVAEHWDLLAVWRVVEIRRSTLGQTESDPLLAPWVSRLGELEEAGDPIERLLAEIEAGFHDADDEAALAASRDQLDLFAPPPVVPAEPVHSVRLVDGRRLSGSWSVLLAQLRELYEPESLNLPDFMRELAADWSRLRAEDLPLGDPESFVRAAERLGLLRIER